MAMPPTLDIAKLLRVNAEPVRGSATLDFSQCDFEGFTVPQPVAFEWRATSAGGQAVRLWLHLVCTLAAECVRCLEPFSQRLEVEKELDITPADLQGAYPEYPTAPGGGLDLQELAYGEVVLEAPILQLCGEHCAGLGVTACSGQEAPVDPRWDALRALLDDEEA